jgi:maleate cis-trans isomerase
MYGERGRIGLITLATDTSVLPEYQRAMPEGVAVYPAPILLPGGEVTPIALAEMLADDNLERAASMLTWAGVGTIGFACTSGSFIHGIGWDRVLVERIERAAGVRATTTATAVVEALRAVGARTVAVATPYTDDLNLVERKFLEGSGFAVATIAGLGCATDPEIGRLGPEDALRLVAEVDHPEADAIFVSCTNWHCLEAVPGLEARFGKPVVTSNLAGAWAGLRSIHVAEAAPGHGVLLDRYLSLGAAA